MPRCLRKLEPLVKATGIHLLQFFLFLPPATIRSWSEIVFLCKALIPQLAAAYVFTNGKYFTIFIDSAALKWLISYWHLSRFKFFRVRHYKVYSKWICQATSTNRTCLVSQLCTLRQRNRLKLTKSRKFNLPMIESRICVNYFVWKDTFEKWKRFQNKKWKELFDQISSAKNLTAVQYTICSFRWPFYKR